MELPPPPWIVGHRGAAAEAPENTLASLRLAAEQGADMIELDLQLTADGVLVACHDWDLERMAGVALVVEAATLPELRRHDVGGRWRGRGPAHRVPTLAEALAALPPERPLDLELKRRDAPIARWLAALAPALAGSVGRPILLSSFDWQLLAAARAELPEVPLAPIAREGAAALVAAGHRLGAWSLHCRHTLVRAPWVAAAGRPVLAYTVNDAKVARRLFRRGVAGVFTDRPGALRAELAASP